MHSTLNQNAMQCNQRCTNTCTIIAYGVDVTKFQPRSQVEVRNHNKTLDIVDQIFATSLDMPCFVKQLANCLDSMGST